MINDFEILRCGSEVRIKGQGKTQEEALASLAKGFAVYQLPANDVVVAKTCERHIKLGYTRKKYLPSDFLNDIIGLEAVNQEIYPEVLDISLANGVLSAKLVGVKKEPRVEPKCAIYIGSSFKQEGEKWLAEAEIAI
jgi:SHS2 domain-containing protein